MKKLFVVMIAAFLMAITAPFASATTTAKNPMPSDNNHRHCVSKHEFWNLVYATKEQIEERWEVVGLGAKDPGTGAWAYKRCDVPDGVTAWYGFRFSEHGHVVRGYAYHEDPPVCSGPIFDPENGVPLSYGPHPC